MSTSVDELVVLLTSEPHCRHRHAGEDRALPHLEHPEALCAWEKRVRAKGLTAWQMMDVVLLVHPDTGVGEFRERIKQELEYWTHIKQRTLTSTTTMSLKQLRPCFLALTPPQHRTQTMVPTDRLELIDGINRWKCWAMSIDAWFVVYRHMAQLERTTLDVFLDDDIAREQFAACVTAGLIVLPQPSSDEDAFPPDAQRRRCA